MNMLPEEKKPELAKQLCEYYRIYRTPLQYLIMRTLDIHDPHTVNGWITKLQAYGLIKTDYSTLPESGKPTRTTIYEVNKEKCKQLIL